MKNYRNKKWLQTQVDKELNRSEIAALPDSGTECQVTISYWLNRFDIHPPEPNYKDKDWLWAQIDKGLNQREIAALPDSGTECQVTISYWLNRFDIHPPEPNYKDKDWLQTQVDKGLTQREIAALPDSGTKWGRTIGQWLNRHDIHPPEPHYKNYEWMKEKFDEGLSSYNVAKLDDAGTDSHATIQRQRKKFGLTRSQAEANHLAQGNHCTITQEAQELFTGHLLGDGCLQSRSEFSAYYSHGGSQEGYIFHVQKTFQNAGIESPCPPKPNKEHTEWNFYTRCFAELLPLREKWYPEGKRILPKDIILTPTICLYWYLDDGSLDKTGKTIVLYTLNFLYEEVQLLCDKLGSIGIDAHPQKGKVLKSGRQAYKIYIPKREASKFLDYIGPCPVECYQYKWAI